MLEFKTLYKRNVNGSINCWTICVDGETYFTKFSKLGGVEQISDKTICTGKNIGKKNETTPEEQSVIEATSIWNRKKEKENFVENVDDVDKINFNPPMLAKVYDKKYTEEIKYIQPKLDGVRCNMSFENGKIKSLSRRNKQFYTTTHIEKEIEDIFKEFPTLHLDGELYNHELHDNFNKIVSLVKKQKLSEEDLKEIESSVKYYVYDLWFDDEPEMLFNERSKFILEKLNRFKNIVVVQTLNVNSEEDVEKYFKMFLLNGFEGAILRLDGIYEHKRSKNLLKYKEFYDDEFEIVNVNIGKTNSIAESLTIMLKNGTLCNATLAFKDSVCKDILVNKEKYIGKKATVCFFGYTNDGMLRFPVVKEIDRENYE